MPIQLKTFLALSITLLLWSSSLVGIRIGLESFDAGSLALLRYLSASICMLCIFLSKYGRHSKPTIKELGLIFLSGIIGFSIYNVALMQGEVTIDPGTASFILTQIPVVMVILAMIFLREKLNVYSWIGIIISILGVALIAYSKSETGHSGIKINIGILYLFIATFCHASYSIINKPLLRKFNSIEFTSYAMWGGTFALLFYAPSLCHEITHATIRAILAAIYIGIFPAVIGYITWSYALKHLSASKVGSSLYAQPIITIILSWILLSEVPTELSLFGGIIALIGSFVIQKSLQVKVEEKSTAFEKQRYF